MFSFVLDRLQFAAKPLLLVGLAFVPVPVGAGLDWLFGHIWPRHPSLDREGLAGGIAYGLALWLLLEVAVVASGDDATAVITSAETFGIALVGIARLLETPTNQTCFDRRRRAVCLGV